MHSAHPITHLENQLGPDGLVGDGRQLQEERSLQTERRTVNIWALPHVSERLAGRTGRRGASPRSTCGCNGSLKRKWQVVFCNDRQRDESRWARTLAATADIIRR